VVTTADIKKNAIAPHILQGVMASVCAAHLGRAAHVTDKTKSV
jgi:hypothetical protein